MTDRRPSGGSCGGESGRQRPGLQMCARWPANPHMEPDQSDLMAKLTLPWLMAPAFAPRLPRSSPNEQG